MVGIMADGTMAVTDTVRVHADTQTGISNLVLSRRIRLPIWKKKAKRVRKADLLAAAVGLAAVFRTSVVRNIVPDTIRAKMVPLPVKKKPGPAVVSVVREIMEIGLTAGRTDEIRMAIVRTIRHFRNCMRTAHPRNLFHLRRNLLTK